MINFLFENVGGEWKNEGNTTTSLVIKVGQSPCLFKLTQDLVLTSCYSRIYLQNYRVKIMYTHVWPHDPRVWPYLTSMYRYESLLYRWCLHPGLWPHIPWRTTLGSNSHSPITDTLWGLVSTWCDHIWPLDPREWPYLTPNESFLYRWCLHPGLWPLISRGGRL